MRRSEASHSAKRNGTAVAWLGAVSLMAVTVPTVGIPAATASTKLSPACTTLRAVIDIVTETAGAAERQSPGWPPIQANGWIAFVPNRFWTISASDAGADINSPNGQQDASLLTWYSLTVPWTLKALGAKFTGYLTRTRYLCDTAVARSASGSSQAYELTGYAGRERIQGVLISSMLTPTTETYVGETRYLYTAASQWDLANAETLAVVMRRAVQVPRSLGG